MTSFKRLWLSWILLGGVGFSLAACFGEANPKFLDDEEIPVSTGVASNDQMVLEGSMGPPVTTSTNAQFRLQGSFVVVPKR